MMGNMNNSMNGSMNRMGGTSKDALLMAVNQAGFAVTEANLYLDTHPDDEEALNYFNQCNTLYNAAKQSYQEQFGLLNAFSEQERFSWDWNTAPMPWEGGM